jgi:1-aminocyclopropane-1-carboxylate deaminase/D-cysteine desulfhydrase-like pyridoxal-dependent ACC family enzyme
MGTMGSAVGLLLGIMAAGLKSRVVAVRVTDEKFVNEKKVRSLYRRFNSYLHSKDTSFPLYPLDKEKIGVRDEYFGEGYASFTEEGITARDLLWETERVRLEGTYTGKTFAAIVEDAHRLRDKVVMFWNTHNSRDLTDRTAYVDYHDLPAGFHRYFTEEVQPLDRAVEGRV